VKNYIERFFDENPDVAVCIGPNGAELIVIKQDEEEIEDD
jgi:hypothetical protein